MKTSSLRFIIVLMAAIMVIVAYPNGVWAMACPIFLDHWEC